MKIGCVLMAAGFGRRFGGNKLTAELGCGETLIGRALSAIPADKLDRVVVVTQYPQVAAPAENTASPPCTIPTRSGDRASLYALVWRPWRTAMRCFFW